MNPNALMKESLYDSLNDTQLKVSLISAKLKSLGHLLCSQSKDSAETEDFLPGIGIILSDLGDDLGLLAEQIDPAKLSEPARSRKRNSK